MALSSSLKQKKTPEEITELLDQLGKLLDRTKVMYEQYFMGIQKRAPSQLHRDIERRIRELTQEQIRNTGLRFRFSTLSQKFGSYNTYWRRIMREIERGEYVRDVRRAGRRARQRGGELPDEMVAKLPKRMRDRILRDREALRKRVEVLEAAEAAAPPTGTVKGPDRGVHVLSDDDVDVDAIFASLTGDGDSPAPEAKRPPRPSPRRPPSANPPPTPSTPARRPPTAPAAVRLPPGMTEGDSRALFDRYRKARKLVGDDRPVSYQQLMGKLGSQAPKIMKDHKADGVNFSVVIKGDKVVLKAKPVKPKPE